jgi:DNA-3-methyladenine glycosylase II
MVTVSRRGKMACSTFELTPASPFRLDLAVWTLRRRSHNILDRWDGTTYRRVLPLPAGPVEVTVTQLTPSEKAQLRINVVGLHASDTIRSAAITALERLLGLRIDLAEFYQFAAHHRRLAPLANSFRGMKPPRFATVFESAINAIACQQMSLTLGIHLLNRLTAAYGTSMGGSGETVHGFPRPADLAELIPAELRQLGFSHQKGRAIIELSQSIAEGHLDLESFTALDDDEALMRLRELRGMGRWSSEYVLLRGLGRTRVFPGDDVGARNNLQRWLRLAEPLDYEGVQGVLSQWDDYAGLVYFHLLLNRLKEAGCLGAVRSDAHCDTGAARNVEE